MDILRLKDTSLKSYVKEVINLSAMLESIEVKTTKTGSPFASIKIKDQDVSEEIKWWDFNDAYLEILKPGIVYMFRVKVQAYDRGKNGISLVIDPGYELDKDGNYHERTVVELEDDPNEYANIEELRSWALHTIERYLAILRDYVLYPIVLDALNKNFDAFKDQSAANYFHHTGLGGLAVHSACVCDLAYRIGSMYNELYGDDFVNLQLLIAGSLLHDVGKTEEMKFDTSTCKNFYTTLSALENHSIIGIKIVAQSAIKCGINSVAVDELIHLIASHHGNTEYGALIQPNCIEAKILSMADDMDATANRFYRNYKQIPAGDMAVDPANKKLLYYKTIMDGRKPKL